MLTLTVLQVSPIFTPFAHLHQPLPPLPLAFTVLLSSIIALLKILLSMVQHVKCFTTIIREATGGGGTVLEQRFAGD